MFKNTFVEIVSILRIPTNHVLNNADSKSREAISQVVHSLLVVAKIQNKQVLSLVQTLGHRRQLVVAQVDRGEFFQGKQFRRDPGILKLVL